jgi:hypothetical protein
MVATILYKGDVHEQDMVATIVAHVEVGWSFERF